MRKLSKQIGLLVFVLQLFAAGKHAHAQTSNYEELQAAYLYNFAKYIKWPGETAEFTIGVLGGAEIMGDLQRTMKGKKAGGKEIVLKTMGTVAEADQCQIVYVSSSGSKELAALLAATAGKNILVVTEDDLARKGAAISFLVEDDKLRFKLNKAKLSAAGLTAAEGLLKLAILQ
jgi:hypothetical protein